MKWMIGAALGALIAGCGADGEPEPPTRDTTIILSNHGGAAEFGFNQGPVRVQIGLGL